MTGKALSALSSVLTASLFLLACTDKGVEPIRVKSPREYSWTVDTLAYPGSYQTSMRDIWGSSPNDLYVVGHNDQPGPGTMFHSDGKSWTTVPFHSAEGGTISGPVSLSGIHGFSAYDIWVVGQRIHSNPDPPPNFLDSSLIVHFDGIQWQEVKLDEGRYVTAIWGRDATNIWAGGWHDPTIWYFDGLSWERDSVPVTIPQDGFFQIDALSGNLDGEVFALGNTYESNLSRTMRYFLVRKENGWVVADSFVVSSNQVDVKFGQNGLWVSPNGTLYSFGPHVFRWTGQSWVKIFETFDALRGIVGTGDNDLVAVGDFGRVLHFDGVNWFVFDRFLNQQVVYSSAWSNGEQIVVVGRIVGNVTKTIILNGR